jgi:hypothetical protein
MPKSHAFSDLSDYAPVAERLERFYERHPAGRIVTELVSREGGQFIFRALVYRNAEEQEPAATGWAAERVGDGDINTVACLENTETSAVGRALANLGFAASTQRPSREEMMKAERGRGRVVPYPQSSSALRRIRERQSEQLQGHARLVMDLFDALLGCEQQGFSILRSQIIRDRVNVVPPLPPRRIEKLEAKLRQWSYRHGLDWLPLS